MNSPQTIVAHNLYSLYDKVGHGVDGVRYFSDENFRMITEKTSAWPNSIYALNSSKLNESLLDDLNDKINEYNFEPILLSEHNPCDLDILKKKGFILVDRWTGMSHNAMNYRRCAINDEADLECCVINNEELPIWINVVSNELFGNKPLSPNIFAYLMSVGNVLIALKKGSKIIGSCMLYYDENDVVCLYIVCI
ncbi:MAG TPA: hypothetical protein PLS50_05135, partial [Candidatus Dojkabacteria bacterium]|nr:hypothetical protein [Candidatus Dojkabacteria bacterium]